MKYSIYLSVVSYMDTELETTIQSLLDNTKHLHRIFIYIFSQDTHHADLESLFQKHNFTSYIYHKVDPKEAKGVGFARAVAQSKLSDNHQYYMQIDSHTQFNKFWDSEIIKDYERNLEKWGDYIYTSYPQPYEYQNNKPKKLFLKDPPPVVGIVRDESSVTGYEAKYVQYVGADIGQETGYFCAGLAFGKSKFFKTVPYDPNIYFWGEEHTLSLRFFEKGIKLVCPPQVYIYHNYNGDKRKRHWEVSENWEDYDKRSIETLNKFFSGIPGKYALKSFKTIEDWANKYINVI
jgi:GT2 family glycosyltransferase